MTADQFENLDELEAEEWIAGRFSEFVSHGFPPDISLLFAVHPEVALPRAANETSLYTAA